MKTRFYYDTEFLDDGRTIDLISIGVVREDGAEYYAVNNDADWPRIHAHRWLSENVVPHLPPSDAPAWKARVVIADEVYKFLTPSPDTVPELWAWFSAYDHVALAQLFGPMISFPRRLPMFTNDLRSLVDWSGVHDLPVPDRDLKHDALADARWVKSAHEHIMRRGRS